MSSTVKFYTVGGNLEHMIIHSVTSADSDYPKERMLDQNPDTAWIPTSTAAQDIIIDAGQSITVDAYVLWVQNYKSSFGVKTFDIYYSDVGTSGPWTDTNDPHLVNDNETPLRIQELVTSYTKRYWKISIESLSTIIQISGLWLTRLYELDQGRAYPDEDTLKYHDSFHVTNSGRIYSRAINRNPIRILPRTYKINDSSKIDTIQNIFNDSMGRNYPIILQEGTYQDEARLVCLTVDQLQQSKVDYELWNVALQFQEVPFIDDGNNY